MLGYLLFKLKEEYILEKKRLKLLTWIGVLIIICTGYGHIVNGVFLLEIVPELFELRLLVINFLMSICFVCAILIIMNLRIRKQKRNIRGVEKYFSYVLIFLSMMSTISSLMDITELVFEDVILFFAISEVIILGSYILMMLILWQSPHAFTASNININKNRDNEG